MTMTRADRIANYVAIVLPFVGVLVAIALLWNRAVDGIDLAIFAVMYLATGFGITVGFHRLFTHRSFAAKRPVEYGLAILGSMAIEGPVDQWVADHRKHHAHSDEDGDPHSPHLGEGSGLRGLWHAHVGWIFHAEDRGDCDRYAPDVRDDPGLLWLSQRFELTVLASLLIPAVAGWALHGWAFSGFLTGLLWGGLVRMFVLHHITWSINSVCHFSGRRRFPVDDQSRNVFWLALPSLGESWHHNHHAFPRSAAHGLRRWEIDPSAMLIRLLKRTGLAWNVIEITPERQREREALARAEPVVAQSP